MSIYKASVAIGLVVILLGRCAYYNVPLEQDEILEKRAKLMDYDKPKYIYEIFPGSWDKVCVFDREYVDLQDIEKWIGIDVSYTRVRVWAGSEIYGTVLFVKGRNVVSAQKISVESFFSMREHAAKNSWCGGRNTTIVYVKGGSDADKKTGDQNLVNRIVINLR